jgi:hypothetical protein
MNSTGAGWIWNRFAANRANDMGELIDEYKRLKAMVQGAMKKKDFAALHKKYHIVDHDQVRAERKENKKGSTRIVLDCRTPEAYKELRAEIDRFFEAIRDPHITIHMITEALRLVSTKVLNGWVETGYGPRVDATTIPVDPATKKAQGPPKAEIPDWLK